MHLLYHGFSLTFVYPIIIFVDPRHGDKERGSNILRAGQIMFSQATIERDNDAETALTRHKSLLAWGDAIVAKAKPDAIH
uniref:hypothetical protein n=1 Tax=Sphingomonas sp. BAUL-RG-20F-R05-02 TaxID=2914830 RepID=UPI001F56C752